MLRGHLSTVFRNFERYFEGTTTNAVVVKPLCTFAAPLTMLLN